jgi:hypothetical protein
VSDILQGLAGAGVPFLLAWVLPSGAALALFAWLELPRLSSGLAQTLGGLDGTNRLLILGLAAFALGTVMSAGSTPLYRLLEGYSWPAGLRASGKRKQLARKESIRRDFVAAQPGPEKALLLERLARFPVDDVETAPSRLGNAMRAFETYGIDRFQLDAISFWTELIAVVPQSVRADVARARSGVDLFVNLVYLGIALAIGAVASFVVSPASAGLLLVVLILSVVTSLGSYRLAVMATSYWDSAVRALIHLGRHPLAQAYGLSVPQSIEAERAMWRLFAAFAVYQYDSAWSDQLDHYRVPPHGGSAAEPGDGNALSPE